MRLFRVFENLNRAETEGNLADADRNRIDPIPRFQA
jgi:hypothetical protein